MLASLAQPIHLPIVRFEWSAVHDLLAKTNADFDGNIGQNAIVVTAAHAQARAVPVERKSRHQSDFGRNNLCCDRLAHAERAPRNGV